MVDLEVITNESCGCCHDFLAMLNNYVKMHKEVTFHTSDISAHKDRGIRGLPYTIVRRNNIEVGTIIGNMSSDMLTVKINEL